MQKYIDLRSDTVTQPTDEMRKAMSTALVGDSILGDDPTVLELQDLGASIFGKPASLFLASGTMANQVAVLSLCSRGDQIIVFNRSHIYNLEVGGLASTCGVQTRAITSRNGCFNLQRLRQEIQHADIQRSPTTLICMENTYDLNKGLVVPNSHFHEVRKIANEFHLPIFLDGARLFNAAISQSLPVSTLCSEVDAVAVCLSKGLGCPIGSLLLGSVPFIERATRMRQRLGGGWRQAGIIAAAGIVALKTMTGRLIDDHDNAKFLAHELINIGVDININEVQTNIINVELHASADEICARLMEFGVKVKKIGPKQIRLVTHLNVSRKDLEKVIGFFSNIYAHKNF